MSKKEIIKEERDEKKVSDKRSKIFCKILLVGSIFAIISAIFTIKRNTKKKKQRDNIFDDFL